MKRRMVAVLKLAVLVGMFLPRFLKGDEKTNAELSIILQPESIINGVPQAFTFVLRNISDGDLRLPQPNVDCTNQTFEGSLVLNESWQPSTGTGLGKGSGTCDFGGSGLPPVPVMERAKNWQLLKRGEAIYITANSDSLHYKTSQSGTYTFSAEYLPPMVSDEQRQLLKNAGIAVPKQKAISGTLQYRK